MRLPLYNYNYNYIYAYTYAYLVQLLTNIEVSPCWNPFPGGTPEYAPSRCGKSSGAEPLSSIRC